MNSEFNAIDYAHQLALAGVPQAQADVHAKALSQGLSTCAATKSDLAALEEKLTTRMDLFEARIDARMDAFEAKINARIDTFEAKINARMDAFEAKINARLDAFEAKMNLQLAEIRGEIAVMRAESKYDRRLLNLVLALQIALIAKAFFF